MKVFPTPQKYKKALRLSWCNTQQMSLHQQRTKLRIGAIWLKKKIFSFQQKITTFTLSKTKDTFVNIAHIQKTILSFIFVRRNFQWNLGA